MMKSQRNDRFFVLVLTLVLPFLMLVMGFYALRPLQAEPVLQAPFDVIINEWSQGNGGTKEWVELLVVNGPADLRGWDLGDDSAGDLTFSSHALWANLPAGTLIIIYNGGDPDTVLPPDDTDPSDYVLIIPHNNPTYFAGAWPTFSNSTTSDNPHVRNPADTTIHNFSADPGATRHPEASECTYYTSNTAPGVSSETNWANDVSALICMPGLGNGGDNTAWINDLRGGGSGPELLATKTGPAGAAAGDAITYTLAVANVGDAAASSVTVTDTLPAGVSYLGHSSNQAVTLIDPTEPTLVWSAGVVISQTTLVITVQVALPVSAAGTVTNTLAVTTTTPGDNPNNNQATATTTILIPGMTLNEIHADPDAIGGDANGDGMVDSSDDEFVELVNNSGQMLDLSQWYLDDGVSTRHIFPAGTLLMPDCGLLVFGGGTPTGPFGGSVVQVASEGSLGLNNTGDTITLYDDLGVAAASYTFGSEGGDNQSLTRSPDVVGPEPFLKHTVVPGSGGTLFSPGTRVDGSVFSSNCAIPTTVTTIPAIQGTGLASTMQGQPVETRGVVVGLFEGNMSSGPVFNGFFLQSQTGDSNPATSDGIFVNLGSAAATVSAGDVVSVTGVVQEFSEYDGANCPSVGTECVTQINVTNLAGVTVVGTGSVAAQVVAPPGDPAAALAYFEAREGMLLTLPVTGTVVGPTNFGTIHVVPGDEGISRVLRNTPYEGMPFGVRHYERYGDIGGSDPPDLIVGSVVTNVAGPLTFSFGTYLVATQAGAAWSVVSSAPTPSTWPTWPAAATDEFTLATLNTLGFDTATGTKIDKVVLAIQALGGPTFLALEEVDADVVMTTLLSRLAQVGYPYAYANSLPDFGGHGIVLLWRTDRVSSADWSTQYQACSPVGSTSSTTDPLWAYCRSIGQYPLFARRPVVLTATVTLDAAAQEVVVIANHFKSKLGGEPSDIRRLQEAQFVAQLVDTLVANGSSYVAMMGDLNDYEDSPPLQALYASGNLTTTWMHVPPEERYSYIFRGVSQILDHILVTPALLAWLQGVAPLHLDADYPYNPFTSNGSVPWRVSDHDPVVATFGPVAPEQRIYLPLMVK